jgi:hypothetical protein
MAIESKKTFLSVTLIDYGGNRANLRFTLKYASLDALNTNIDDVTGTGGFIDLLKAVTNAEIYSYDVGEAFGAAPKAYPSQGVEVEEQALISCAIDGEVDKFVNLKIPAPKPGIFLTGPGENANVVDTTDADLRAYLAMFTSATGVALVSDGENIVDPTTQGSFKGHKVHRGSRLG